MNVSASNWPSSNGSERASPSCSRTCFVAAASAHRCRPDLEHLGALVDADDVAVLLAHELERDGGRAGGDVEHRVGRAGRRCRETRKRRQRGSWPNESTAPSGRSRARAARRGCVASIRLDSMALREDLERIAGAAAAHGQVAGVLAAEPARGRRLYLVALGDEASGAGSCSTTAGRSSTRRDDVRDTASIVAMCELAEDLAGGGDLEQLRSQLARVRMVEQPPGIEEAEEAALALERVIGAPPRLATPAYPRRGRCGDDRARAGARRDVVAVLGGDPRRRRGAVDEFVREVERGYAGSPCALPWPHGRWIRIPVRRRSRGSAARACASSRSSRRSRCRRRSASSSRR